MRGLDSSAGSSRFGFGSSDGRESSVGGEDDVRGDGRLESSVEVGEAFDVEHVDLREARDEGEEEEVSGRTNGRKSRTRADPGSSWRYNSLNLESIERREEDTHLINEQHSRHQLCDSLLDVPVDDLVDLSSQLVRHLGPSTLHQLTHHAHDVLSSLRSSVGHVEIVQSNVLDELLLLVDVSFGKRNVGLGLEIVFRSVGV